jgi:hypothetical protein
MTDGHQCPPHHWRIDKNDVGKCIYCLTVKDFGKLQGKERRRLGEASRRGQAARKTSLGKRRGRPPKYG